MNPLIITLRIDAESQNLFDDLRKKHFPVHLNYLKSHLTLFHNLPADEPAILNSLKQYASRPVFSLHVDGIRHTGFGVAYTITAPELLVLQSSLANVFEHWLTPQDKQKFQPHITVQNKVSAASSKSLQKLLSADFVAFVMKAEGLDTWLYQNGPWQHVEFFPFSPVPT